MTTNSIQQELLISLKRLLEAFEADKNNAPGLTIEFCWETNGVAIAAARSIIAKAESQL